MAKKPYDEVSVIKILSKKKDCSISNKRIEVLSKAKGLGNSTWGKIDYLVKVHGYTISVVNKFGTVPKVRKEVDEIKTVRKKKINMASMSKTAMRNASSKE